MLRRFEWLAADSIILVHEDVPMLFRDDLRVYLSILRDAIRYSAGRRYRLVALFPSRVRPAIDEVGRARMTLDQPASGDQPLRIQLDRVQPGAATVEMDCVIDLDDIGHPIGIELISPRAIATSHGLQFSGEGSQWETTTVTTYDEAADALYVRIAPGRSRDQRNGMATLVLSLTGALQELIVRVERSI